ncbi:MAG: oligosaccharide flippase family protein, partial [Planctomycetales bacterium]|nr:oligosaccharide flippase family protein [Planctomycetales bacterium]
LVGLENIGVVCFQKEMKFHLDFRYLFLKRLAGFLTTIVAAWFMRSYWALVIGALAGRSFGTILSYLIHPMRPRLSLQKFDDIFSVSQWMLVRSIGAYLNKNLHMFFVGNRADTATMGGYSLADQISAMPTTELLAPLNRVLFPAFVQARENISELKRLFLLAQGVQTLAAIPAAVGLALVAHEAVLILLGEKWLIAVPFVEWLALGSAFSAIATSGGYILITMGKVKDAAVVTWANVALFVIGALVLSPEAGALDLAKLRLATVVLGLLLALILLKRTLVNLSSLDMLRTVYRPIIGASAMAVAIGSAPFSSTIAPLVALQLKIGIGLVVFPATVLFVWWFAGKPEGAERYLLEKAVYITRNFRS